MYTGARCHGCFKLKHETSGTFTVFPTTSHHVVREFLLAKLPVYGIRSIALFPIETYVSCRKRMAQMGHKTVFPPQSV